MTECILYAVCSVAYFLILKKYISVAKEHGIVDVPNHRTSHEGEVVRAGGIIFPIAAIISMMFDESNQISFYTTLILISILCFVDDKISLSASLRLSVHFILSGILLFSITHDWVLLLPFCFVFVGLINVYNFMDGINGMTGINALITLVTFLLFIKTTGVGDFESLIIQVIIAVLVFLFFNFRRKAECFAGDVGSISMAFILCGLIVFFVNSTNNFAWLLLSSVYVFDGVSIIVIRFLRRENVMTPHRRHFFQYLVNIRGLDHRVVSLIYGALQIIINVVFFKFFFHLQGFTSFIFAVSFLFVGTFLWVLMRLIVHGKKYLFNKEL